MATLTAQTRNSVTLTAEARLAGASISAGMAIGLLLALTYATSSGATTLTAESRNSATLTPQTKN